MSLMIFAARIPGMVQRFNYERARWEEFADIEMLDPDHPVLLIRLGTAWKQLL